MKVKYFTIPKMELDIYEAVIRNSYDYYKLLFKSVQLILASTPATRPSNNVIVVYIDKISRLIYRTKTRLFSINFPFTMIENGDSFDICLHSVKIDSYTCSLFIGLLESAPADMEDLLNRIYDEDISTDKRKELLEILSALNETDSGYVRFDCDIEHEKGKKHPKFHFDIFFDTNINIKIGLMENLSLSQFTDIMDLSANCWYLKNK